MSRMEDLYEDWPRCRAWYRKRRLRLRHRHTLKPRFTKGRNFFAIHGYFKGWYSNEQEAH